MATTAATMMAICALIFRPPPPGCGCIGMVGGCGYPYPGCPYGPGCPGCPGCPYAPGCCG
ncbi:hypothetical protein GCM10010297_44030 [Streptomyces malachitofuscus]|nr:hypothetical protein GCM10010297_44030 [Streptomyces malachitofuscus]